MKRVRCIRQLDRHDCGAACLAALAGAYGYEIPLARIRDLASTCREGTSVAGLIEAASSMGFIAKGVKGRPAALPNAPLPAIAHLKQSGGCYHFVVITTLSRTNVKYMDPAAGRVLKRSFDAFCKEWTGVMVLLSPGPDFRTVKELPATFQRFRALIRPYRRAITQALFGAILFSILGLSTSLYVQKIVDFVMINRNVNLLNLISLTMIALALSRILISWFKGLLMLKTGSQVDAGLINRYYRHLLNLPQRFFDTMHTGDIISRVGDAIKIRRLITEGLVDMVVGGLTIIVTLSVMAILSFRLCLMMLITFPVFIFIFWAYDKVNKRLLRAIMEEAAKVESNLVESIRSHRMIRENHLQSKFTDQMEHRFTRLLIQGYQSGVSQLIAGHSVEFIGALLTILLLWSGTLQVLHGKLSAGELMSYYALTGYLLGPVRGLTSVSRIFRDAGIAADRLFQILDNEQERNLVEGLRVPSLGEEIRFEGVGFRYGTRPLLFSDLSFRIRVGEMTAIAGPSGCGKSTVACLLEGLYHPVSGRILINGVDLAHLDKTAWRRKIAIVPQQILLFSGTLLENIVCAERFSEQHRLLSILERTGLLSLVNQLPEGINTPLGEHGYGLSGGERQRLAFARALYHQPELLILDEPTSALDPEAEQMVRTLMLSLREEGMTLLIMAHQLRTIAAADQIILLENGMVAASGNHEELLRAGGIYAEYWHQQQCPGYPEAP